MGFASLGETELRNGTSYGVTRVRFGHGMGGKEERRFIPDSPCVNESPKVLNVKQSECTLLMGINCSRSSQTGYCSSIEPELELSS